MIGRATRKRHSRIDEAVAWRARQSDGADLPGLPEFREWTQDGANQRVFENVAAVWDVFAPGDESPELRQARQAALLRAGRYRFDRARRRRAFAAASAIMLCVAVSAGLWIMPRQGSGVPPQVYATQLDERRVVLLGDGSRVSLDAASQVDVNYQAGRRQLALRRGQAAFDVARDPARPFTVAVGDKRITAVGTRFNVERLDRTLIVSMIQGVVSLAGPGYAYRLTAGQQVRIEDEGRPVFGRADIADVLAWENGRLSFTDVPLGKAISRVNRYTARPVKLDPALRDLRISGEFVVGDTESFVDGVTSYFPIRAVPSSHGSLTLEPR